MFLVLLANLHDQALSKIHGRIGQIHFLAQRLSVRRVANRIVGTYVL